MNFSLQKDYSSKWVGEKFPSFFEKNSKIRSHVVKKSNVFVSQNMNLMKISKFFSDSKNGFGTFLVKNEFHQWSHFPSKKRIQFQVGGRFLTTQKNRWFELKIHFYVFKKSTFSDYNWGSVTKNGFLKYLTLLIFDFSKAWFSKG